MPIIIAAVTLCLYVPGHTRCIANELSHSSIKQPILYFRLFVWLKIRYKRSPGHRMWSICKLNIYSCIHKYFFIYAPTSKAWKFLLLHILLAPASLIIILVSTVSWFDKQKLRPPSSFNLHTDNFVDLFYLLIIY